MQIDEIDDISKYEFKKLIAEEKKHTELVAILKQLLQASKGDNSKDAELAKLIQKSNGNIDVFLAKLREMAAPIVNAPNVTVDTESVVAAINRGIKAISDDQDKTNSLLQKLIELRLANVELTPHRDGGLIDRVTAKTIVPNKPKYEA